ncbi:MAG: hypothetical protein HYX47_15210 [Burkholderiales bacterium]|nr:hypothetical protein [Burkholderiales bacterium]
MRILPIFLSFCAALLAAQAHAAQPAVSGQQAERYQAAVREAGQVLNTSLTACREQAGRSPAPSRRDLKECERTARATFRLDMKHARKLRRQPA